MEKVFEDVFMEVQARLVSLALEFAGETPVDKIFLYGSLEKKTRAFNALFQRDGQILTLQQLDSDRDYCMQFLKLGTEDLGDVAKVCAEYSMPTPTELKLCFDVHTRRLDTHYQYKPVCTTETGITTTQQFLAWRQELVNSLKESE